MDVAMPITISSLYPIGRISSDDAFFRTPSTIILVPIAQSKIIAIQGIQASNAVNSCRIVCTHV